MRWYLEKIQSCTFAIINNSVILQVSITFFSDTLRPRYLKFFLCIQPYGYSMQTKFHVPRSHSYREKCGDNLEKFKVAYSPKWTTLNFYNLASHFSPILCDRRTWNLFSILTHMDTLCKPNFMFLGHTVFEKNAMISWKYHRTFLRYCATEELEIFFVH